MKKVFFLMMLAVAAVFVGCKKEDEEFVNLEVVVNYASYTRYALQKSFEDNISGVEVKLYKTKSDAVTEKNEVAKGVTDANGKILFQNLEEREYIIVAGNDNCLTNLKDIMEDKAIVTVKKSKYNNYKSIGLEQTSIFKVTNKLNKVIYVSIDENPTEPDSYTRTRIEIGGSENGWATPLFLRNRSNYLDHTFFIYDTPTGGSWEKIVNVTFKLNCDVQNVELK